MVLEKNIDANNDGHEYLEIPVISVVVVVLWYMLLLSLLLSSY